MDSKPLGKTKYTENIVFGAVDRSVPFFPFSSDQSVVVGDGKVGFCVPANLNGKSLTGVTASVVTQGTTGCTTQVQVRRLRGASPVDMLSGKITLTTSDFTTSTCTIDGANDDLLTGDLVYIDVDSVTTVAPLGLSVTLTFA